MSEYCPQCGEAVAAGDRFCGGCGASLTEVAEETASPGQAKGGSVGGAVVEYFFVAFLATVSSLYVGFNVLGLYTASNYMYQYLLEMILFISMYCIMAFFISRMGSNFVVILLLAAAYTLTELFLGFYVYGILSFDSVHDKFGEDVAYVVWAIFVGLCFAPIALVISRLMSGYLDKHG